MKVNTKADNTDTIGEMTTGEPEVGLISEMVRDASKLDNFIPGLSKKGQEIAEGDDNPEFAILRVEEGWSNSGRLWNRSELDSIVKQTNELEPVGHLGHIPDDQEAFAFPQPQTTWIGAVAKDEPSKNKARIGEMVRVAYFAGYNHPDAPVRSHIKRRAVRGISWWGRGEQVRIPGKGVEVRNFTLKSIDWARKLAEGMPTSSIVAITGEQESSGMAKELSQVTPEEFKTENPNGYALLVNEAVADKDKTIGEMQEKLDEAEDDKSLIQKLCEAIGIEKPDELLAKVTELKTRIGDKARVSTEAALDKLLAEKVQDEQKRALVRRLLPVGEMESKVADAKDAEEVEKLIGEMVTAEFDKDETIKTLIGEMSPPVVRRREELRTGEKNPYIERETVKFGS